jgi:hypothetical protein
MRDDDWSQPEIVRAVMRIEASLKALDEKVDRLQYRPLRIMQTIGTGILFPLIVTAMGLLVFGRLIV